VSISQPGRDKKLKLVDKSIKAGELMVAELPSTAFQPHFPLYSSSQLCHT
jgi:hypothetical protein